MTPESAFAALGIALGLGLLVGLQRERITVHFAGVRTFPLITVLGALCAILAERWGGWLIACGLVGVIVASVVGNVFGPHRDPKGSGITTEIAMLVMYLVGALAWTGPVPVAVVVGGGVAVLLHAKDAMHTFALRLGEKDARAIFQFALLSLVILPVLPNQSFGPEPIDVLNPRQIWLMVVLVVAIGLGGYAAYKLVGARTGAVLAGILGGMISSTATTVSYSRRSMQAPRAVAGTALVVMLASTVVYARILTEIAVVAPNALRQMAPPILMLAAASAVLAFFVWIIARKQTDEIPEQANPTQLKAALAFGAMFATILVAVAAGKHFLGDKGLYVIAALSGMTDMDAITLSTARLVNQGRLDVETGWRAVVVASMSSQVFKLGIVATLGTHRLALVCAGLFTMKLLAGAAVLLLW